MSAPSDKKKKRIREGGRGGGLGKEEKRGGEKEMWQRFLYIFFGG
jgi:hypothetical protein